MSDAGPRRERGVAAPVDEHDAFAELQALLVGPEREQLASIRERIDDPDARRREVADVLPQVLLKHASDPRFTHALTPPVERAITASVRKNPGPLADALFPVMGPAIRKAVNAALAGMVEGLNRTLDHSLSWRSLAWRIEALRTGRSFGEVMLAHTLVYRVEQLFLIERTSGLLLQHIAPGTDGIRDADMVSGMLTAIRDFVKDSFTVDGDQGVGLLQVGECCVWVEQGPRAILAAVVRGVAPVSFRAALQAALERIHLEFADEFDSFNGDASAFDAARPTLEACLHAEYQKDAAPRRRLRPLALAAAVVAILLVAWAAFAYRARSRWNQYVDALNAEPGIVVISSGKRGGKYMISGLRDPLARDPATLLAAYALSPGDVDTAWKPYQAAAPSLALARARQVLQPPGGVTLDLKDGVLFASGPVPLAWLAEASRLAPFVPGVTRLDAAGAADAAVRSAIARIEGLSPLFVKGQAALVPGQEEVIQQLVARAAELERAAAATGKTFRVEVIGHTDADGLPGANIPLSRARAAVVRLAIERVVSDRLRLVDEGVGSDDPAVQSDNEQDKQRNRRVTVRVTALSAASR